MSTQHTPGRIEAQCVGVNQAYLVTKAHGNERAIAMVMIATPEGPHNLRRLAACWNACEGLSTEALEQEPYIGGASFMMRRRAELQRDEAIAALRLAREVVAADRTAAHEGVVNQAAGSIDDPLDAERVAKYDRALQQIDSAITNATTRQP